MIWHPLVMAVLTLDLLALVLALYAALPYGRVLLGWAPESVSRRQVALEGATEGASMAARYAVWASLAGTGLLVVAITLSLPGLIPGAMCGTGVMSGTQGLGERALALRGLALGVLWVWRTLEGLNRSAPRPPATPQVARWHLLSLPLQALGALYTFRAMRQLDPHQPTDCCQSVYATFQSVEEARTTAGLSDEAWLWGWGAGAALVLALSLLSLGGRRRAARGALTVASLLWAPVASVALVRVLSAYHYQVLHHHCPWCLFLPEHHLVGYPLFGALLLVCLEALALWSASNTTQAHPELARGGQRRARRAAWRILAATLLFVALTAAPALWWRLQHGVWMSG